ncbi:MAG: methanogenesis marker 14 protein [ANME-2 cluster archaeon]|nr:methanogenesis marker 14 protein [ANME-2 cluster archaeon]
MTNPVAILFNHIRGPKPRISQSPYVRLLDLKSKPYFIVASVEVGNTTTKSILTATNLETGKTSLVNKTVKMTRDVRSPRPDEEIFGKTLTGVPFTRESVAELVRDTLLESVQSASLDIKEDLHFVVRSTGVVAGFNSPDEVGNFVKALADGCMMAGVPPKNMIPAMSIENVHARFRKFSLIKKIVFTGAVGGVLPPTGASGLEIVANEMEGELATAGIKEGAKWTGIDFRNPCVSIDFGTTLDGRITNDDSPYAKTVGNFAGYAGAIPDAIIKGTHLVDEKVGTALDLFNNKPVGLFTWMRRSKVIQEYAARLNERISIEVVPDNVTRYGSVPVNPGAAKGIGVTLIGCDVGKNGSGLEDLSKIGGEVYRRYGLSTMFAVVDTVCADMAQRMVKVAMDRDLVTEKSAIGFTGRAAITGCKPRLILNRIQKLGLYDAPENSVVFVDDGLARGAAVMARCMNSLGTPKNPLGGTRGNRCVLRERMKIQGSGRIDKKDMEKLISRESGIGRSMS